ncbi:MAG: DUF5317 domain-containing protein [Mycobacterium leprae]
MLLDVLLLSFIVALVRKGRPSKTLGLKDAWVIFLALGIQVLAVLVPRRLSPIFILLSFCVLLIGLVRNLHVQSLRLVFLGVLLNVLVIASNHGQMPVSLSAAERLGVDTKPLVAGTDYKRVAMTDKTRFDFLGDVIYVPVPLPRVVSLGDVVVAFGAFLLVQEYMGKPITFRVRSLSL